MGIAGISIGKILFILLVVLIVYLIFGGKRLKNLGSDFGNAIKSFRKAVREHDEESPALSKKDTQDSNSKKDS